MELKTPLYAEHLQLGAKMVPFAGYIMPVQYPTGVIAEHMAVRTSCGLFDTSHMGVISCKGSDAVNNLNYLLTNDFRGMPNGRARYTTMCNEAGGVLDDLLVYKKTDDDFLLVVNASNRHKAYRWIASHAFGACAAEDISDAVGMVALQGPSSRNVLRAVVAEDQFPSKYYTAMYDVDLGGISCMVAQTGYTGDDGFEIYCDTDRVADLWRMLLDAGADVGLIPCGLGARDTLRIEASMPLYGHEIDETISPIEAGLHHAVKMDKEDFIGKAALAAPPARTRIGLKVIGRGIIREEQIIYKDGAQIGITTSGTHAPFFGYPIAMAMVAVGSVKPGDIVSADVRGRMVDAEVVALPFYTRGMPRP